MCNSGVLDEKRVGDIGLTHTHFYFLIKIIRVQRCTLNKACVFQKIFSKKSVLYLFEFHKIPISYPYCGQFVHIETKVVHSVLTTAKTLLTKERSIPFTGPATHVLFKLICLSLLLLNAYFVHITYRREEHLRE